MIELFANYFFNILDTFTNHFYNSGQRITLLKSE